MKRAAVLGFLLLLPLAAQAVNYTLVPAEPVKICPLNSLNELDVYLTNLEATDQDFMLIKSQDLPSWNWQASICVNGLCYAPFFDTIQVTVAAGDRDTIGVWISAYVDQGSGEALLRVYPMSEPANEKTQVFAAITNGVDVLVVDDDGGETYQSYYTGALPGGLIHGRWPRIAQAPTAANLSEFDEVIWFTGEADPSLDASDRAAISTFLNSGGKLFLSGQNIAYSLCDAGSPEYSAAARDFVEEYLASVYVSNNSGSTSVDGIPKSLGQGLSFSIAGGASNQSSPDVVRPGTNFSGKTGVSCFAYTGVADAAGIQSFGGGARVVFLSFGLEGITSLTTRQAILQRAFDFFDAVVGVEGGVIPRREVLSANRPNPFNPSTSLVMRLDKASAGSVSVFDAGGRLVRTLSGGVLPAGETEIVWDGTDDRGSPVRSGVYFVRLDAGDQTLARKVSLVR
ncbi:MAG: T9SS type A sorting domain-containing protein [Candidatus Eisenbacteria bacterium]|nr:T9SS type A sorting domain-containing protein [Candidatus Eisenbacteria bacterium]